MEPPKQNNKSNSITSPLNWINWILFYWYERRSLIISLPLAFYFGYRGVDFLFSESEIKLIAENFWETKILGGISALIILLIVWFWTRRVPKTKRRKIGIILAIRSNNQDALGVKNDVVEKFTELIKDSSIGDVIDLISLKDFLARKVIGRDSAIIISDKSGGHFIVWGKSRSYKFNHSTNQYEFDLGFLVRHRKGIKEKEIMRRSFRESLVNKKWQFLEKDILSGIRVTANNIKEVALYIIGIAAFLSYDFNTSRNFHLEFYKLVRGNSQKKKELNPAFKRVHEFLSDSFNILGLDYYYKNKNTEGVKRALFLTNKALSFFPNHTAALTNKALYLFLLDNKSGSWKIIKVIREINFKHSFSDSTWRLSEAFLLFLDGNFKKGLRSYRKGFRGYISDFSLNSTINFIKEFLSEHPEKVQFIYALGFIHYSVRNFPEALEFFEKFLKNRDDNPKLLFLIKNSKNYLLNIYKEMDLTS